MNANDFLLRFDVVFISGHVTKCILLIIVILVKRWCSCNIIRHIRC